MNKLYEHEDFKKGFLRGDREQYLFSPAVFSPHLPLPLTTRLKIVFD